MDKHYAGELLQKVYEGIREQGGPAYGTSGCAYRTKGRKCAMGLLIPDELYTEDMEGAGAEYIVSRYLPELTPYTQLLAALQTVHDGAADLSDGEGNKAFFDAWHLGCQVVQRALGLTAHCEIKRV